MNEIFFPQVTIEYKFDHGACIPLRVHTVVISTQHSPQVTQEQLRDDLRKKIIEPVIPANLLGKIICVRYKVFNSRGFR